MGLFDLIDRFVETGSSWDDIVSAIKGKGSSTANECCEYEVYECDIPDHIKAILDEHDYVVADRESYEKKDCSESSL